MELSCLAGAMLEHCMVELQLATGFFWILQNSLSAACWSVSPMRMSCTKGALGADELPSFAAPMTTDHGSLPQPTQ